MIVYNYDVEFAWKHIQKDSISNLVMAYNEAYDIDLRLTKDKNGVYLALEDEFEIISKEYVLDLIDLKESFDKYIGIMQERK